MSASQQGQQYNTQNVLTSGYYNTDNNIQQSSSGSYILESGQGLASGSLGSAGSGSFLTGGASTWTTVTGGTYWPSMANNELTIRKVENGYILRHDLKEYVFMDGTQAVKFLELLGKDK